MSRTNPYTQRQIQRARRAILNCGLFVTGIQQDGTVLCSDVDERECPTLSVVPQSPLDPRARSMARGFIYFISDGDFIKIGFATDWRARRKELQIANPRLLTPLLILEGGHRMERHLHWLFRDHRINGEWFHPAPALLEYIANHEGDDLA